MKILITGGKSAVALKMLKAFLQHEIIFADYGVMPNFSSPAYRFISLGTKNEDTTAHSLLSICLDERVDIILPLYDFEILALDKAKVLFSEFDINILLPDNVANYSVHHVKLAHWTVFSKGEALFMSLPNEELILFAKTSNLSGAFYFNSDQAVANLTLITI